MLRRDLPGFDNLPEDPKDGVKYLRKKDLKWYNLWAGSTAIVDPVSKAKSIEKARGRKCLVLWLDAFGHAGIKYLDSGRYGEREVGDLIPLLTKPIDMEVYRASKATKNKD